jgi:tRNA nucleotidyltransferase (CCA-adding enzyme)
MHPVSFEPTIFKFVGTIQKVSEINENTESIRSKQITIVYNCFCGGIQTASGILPTTLQHARHPNCVGNITENTPDVPPATQTASGILPTTLQLEHARHPNCVGNITDNTPDVPPATQTASGILPTTLQHARHPNCVGNITDNTPDVPPATQTASGIFPTTPPTPIRHPPCCRIHPETLIMHRKH